MEVFLLSLPEEMILNILKFASPVEICRLACTCRFLHEVSQDRHLWFRLAVSHQFIAPSATAEDDIDWFTFFKQRFCRIGILYGCGSTGSGRLGVRVHSRSDLVPIADDDQKFSQIAAGWYHNLVVDRNGQVFQIPGRPGEPMRSLPITNPVKVSCNTDHSMLLDSQNHVYTWGANSSGQLGYATNTATTTEPACVEALFAERIVDIAAGEKFSVAVTSEGTVYAWGRFRSIGPLPTVIELPFAKTARVYAAQAYWVALSTEGNVAVLSAASSGKMHSEFPGMKCYKE